MQCSVDCSGRGHWDYTGKLAGGRRSRRSSRGVRFAARPAQQAITSHTARKQYHRQPEQNMQPFFSAATVRGVSKPQKRRRQETPRQTPTATAVNVECQLRQAHYLVTRQHSHEPSDNRVPAAHQLPHIRLANAPPPSPTGPPRPTVHYISSPASPYSTKTFVHSKAKHQFGLTLSRALGLHAARHSSRALYDKPRAPRYRSEASDACREENITANAAADAWRDALAFDSIDCANDGV